MTARIMVTITVQRGAEWEPQRTLTLADESIEPVREAWLAEFPMALHRAIKATPEPEGDDEPDEAGEAPTLADTGTQGGLGL